MRYEIRINGRTMGRTDDQDEALRRVREAVRHDASAEPEIIDTVEGKPLEIGATEADRDRLANKIGF